MLSVELLLKSRVLSSLCFNFEIRCEMWEDRRCNSPEISGENMNRKKLKQSLGLVNLAIFVGLIFFYPTYKNRSISYSSEFERAINEFTVARNWSDISAILIVSLLATASLYLFITAFHNEKN
jgi:hypothetical protein